MKTLVIHPKDPTTDFLSEIYNGTDWTVINYYMNETQLKKIISKYDRIIMMGHGFGHGLIGYKGTVINNSFADLLREKECVYIWCHANKFVEKNNLKGFNTGMIVSEIQEAYIYSIPATADEIDESNKLFSETIKKNIFKKTMLEEVKFEYVNDDNPVIFFNKKNIFHS